MIIAGRGKVWDANKKTHLCVFGANGLLNTEDEYVIRELLAKGYKEVENNEMVSIYEYGGTNVDWKLRYTDEHNSLVALQKEFEKLQAKLKSIQQSTGMVVAVTDEVVEEDVAELLSDNYILGDDMIPKDIATMGLMKIKSILKKYDALQGRDFRKINKDDAVIMMAQLLEREGIAE